MPQSSLIGGDHRRRMPSEPPACLWGALATAPLGAFDTAPLDRGAAAVVPTDWRATAAMPPDHEVGASDRHAFGSGSHRAMPPDLGSTVGHAFGDRRRALSGNRRRRVPGWVSSVVHQGGGTKTKPLCPGAPFIYA